MASKKSKRKQPKRRSSREIKKQLRSIYTGADGKMPDLTTLSQGPSRLSGLLVKIIILLVILAGIAWAGFFLFTQGFFQNSESLTLTIEGPEDVSSGEEVSYTIRYENDGAVPIASLSMKLNLPSTFHLYHSIPESTSSDEWTIGSLTPGSDGAITITGVFLAEVESAERIQGLFTYKPANFSSDFQDIVTHKIDVTDSVVALTLTGPEKALAGDNAEYIVNIQNTYTDPVFNLRILPSLPADFTVLEAEPALDEGETYWSVDTLEPGELKAFTLRGSFTSTATGEQTVGMGVGFVAEDLYLQQRVEEMLTDVLGGNAGFSLIINGSSSSQTAELGETLRVSIAASNNGQETIENIQYELVLEVPPLPEGGLRGEGVPINWNKASLDGGVRSANTVTYTSTTHDHLEELAPEEEGVIDLSLPIPSSLAANESDRFTVQLKATLSSVGGVQSTRTIDSTPIEIQLNSDARVSAHGRYYSEGGTAIGSGPMPPEVGETTSYRIYWNLQNSLHALDEIKFATTLPQDVAWLENTDTDIGSVSYNPTTRQVTWSISRLPNSVTSAGAWFEIAINPSEADVGTFMKLTNTTSFSAKDAETGDQLSSTMSEVSTDLQQDSFAEGEAVVIE